MKLLKILLLIALLSLSIVAYGTGVITSGNDIITFEAEKPTTLNEWFCNLSLSEKIEIYNQYNK